MNVKRHIHRPCELPNTKAMSIHSKLLQPPKQEPTPLCGPAGSQKRASRALWLRGEPPYPLLGGRWLSPRHFVITHLIRQ